MPSTRQLSRNGLAGDVAAGVAVAAVSVPIVLAYAGLTGLPVQAGLYAAILGAVAYATFGPSRIIVGPDTATCVLIGATLTQLGSHGTGDRGLDAAILALLVGLFCLAGSFLHLGAIANLLSKPILHGYLIGVAASLFVGQYHNLTDVKIVSDGIVPPTLELIEKSSQIHVPTLIFGLSLFVGARLLKRFVPAVPAAVAILLAGIGLSWLLNLREAGFAVVGNVRLGLPSLPKVTAMPDLTSLLIDALGIALVCFSSGIVTVRSFAAQLREEVEPNLELRGFGLANIAAALGMGYPVSGADSRTAVALSAGGQTRWVAVFAAIALILMTLFLNRPLSILPEAALGAILASAAVDLMDLKSLWRLWRVSRFELVLGVLTAVTVVWLGVMRAIAIAIGASLVHLLWYASTPKDALQGVIPGRNGLYDLGQHDRAEPIAGILVYKFEGSPLFFNASWFRQRARLAFESYPHRIRWFLLNARMMAALDSTAQDEIIALVDELKKRNVIFVLAGGGDRFREIVARGGLADAIGRENVFVTVSAALLALRPDLFQPAQADGGPKGPADDPDWDIRRV
jgi:MFS superfamily sulfate permease-like transporter